MSHKEENCPDLALGWAGLQGAGQDNGPARGAHVAQLPACLSEELLEPQSLCTPKPWGEDSTQEIRLP